MTTKRTLLVLCVGLTVLSGVLRGVVDQRWGFAEGMIQAAERVKSLASQIGPWHVTHEQALDSEAAEMLRCAGSLVRTYVHEDTGEAVSLIFLVGPAGPLAIHTPEVCYGSSNFTVVEQRRHVVVQDVEKNEHPFSVITFSENKVGQRLQRVYYAWNRSGQWMAPDRPRSAFAGMPMLYKVQVATHDVGDKESADAAKRFIRACLPVWQEICK